MDSHDHDDESPRALEDACLHVERGLPYLASARLAALLAVPSLLGNLSLILLLSRSKSLPLAIRINLTSFSAALALSSVAALLGAVLEQYVQSSSHDHSLALVHCVTLNGYKSFAQQVVALSALAVAVERWRVGRSVEAATGEQLKPRVVVLCLAVAWLAPAVLLPFGTAAIKCTCQPNVGFAAIAELLITLAAFAVVQVLTAVAMWYVWRQSRTEIESFCQTSTRHNLAARFQARENVAITVLLFPTMLLQSLIWAIDALSAAASALAFRGQTTTTSKAMDTISQLMAAAWISYATAHPILIIARNAKLRQRLCGWLRCSNSAEGNAADEVVDFHITPDTHGDLTDKFWATASVRMKSQSQGTST